MFGTIGLPYKLAAIGILVAGIFLGGFYTCYRTVYLPERDSFVSFTAKVKQIGETQAAQSKAKDLEYEHNTQTIADGYAVAYERLQHARSRSSAVSKPSQYSLPANAAIGQYGSTCTRTFYWNGLSDALKVQKFQEWVTVNHIPVK